MGVHQPGGRANSAVDACWMANESPLWNRRPESEPHRGAAAKTIAFLPA